MPSYNFNNCYKYRVFQRHMARLLGQVEYLKINGDCSVFFPNGIRFRDTGVENYEICCEYFVKVGTS